VWRADVPARVHRPTLDQQSTEIATETTAAASFGAAALNSDRSAV
jgi:hypothetical protein